MENNIMINCLEEIINTPKDDNITDVILDVNVSDEYYAEHDYNKEEYPEDAWTIWVTQNDFDRKEKSVSVCLCNEGLEVDAEITGEEKEKILQYIKDNGFDITAKLVLPDEIYCLDCDRKEHNSYDICGNCPHAG